MTSFSGNPDFWRYRPTLVTGATGLLGNWIVRALVELKADVVCLVRDWVPQSELVRSGTLDQVKVVRGDVRDAAVVTRVLAEYEVDTVLHLAAQTIVGTANRSPTDTLEVNIAGTWVLLEAVRQLGSVKQVVLASSDKAYGDQEVLPYTEDMPLQGMHVYDVSKSCADLIAQAYAKSYKTPVAITRCGNFYGGGDLNWNRLVPGTIRSLLDGKRPLIRSDGTLIRDYVYAEDAVGAYLLLAEKLAENPELRGEAFNFSNENQITVLDMVGRITRLMGLDIEPDVRNEASNEILHQYLSAEKARRLLDWSPRFTTEEGLTRTIDWYRSFLTASV
ncbi:NAD-dependent epimerase/dehydratase family protein [Limobrevibacterium gyesilva]|uniref:GDP-mannose 4,6-dehydratase n=1 Tax=Limobrevibacterium gyesilva TaxID=2991712 RepID=A0AA42CCT3_9PROT|nr:NAD-dependent epimerase/dehydratase family protein [Limobrevibacterium gyesilva]MCW3473928.1 GDP-mannose 4,6-dehydratase [Limobrevibacterium gyesilva]